VERAASLGLRALSLTDHDTMSGIDQAWSVSRRLGLTFVPGVELSTDVPGAECHILGYFVDHRHPALREALAEFQRGRRERGVLMVERLYDLGVPVSWERVQELAQGGTVARPHVAEALLEAGHVSSRQEAFERFIGNGGPAYVSRCKLSPEESIRLVRQAHGVPVLAHPTFADPGYDFTVDPSQQANWPFLERLCQVGLLGLEAYYSNYTPDLSARLVALARQHGLIVTGGSDFHGSPESPALGSVPVPLEAVSDLQVLAECCGSPWMDRVLTSARS